MSPILAASLELIWVPQILQNDRFCRFIAFLVSQYNQVCISSKHTADPKKIGEYMALLIAILKQET